MSAPLLHLKERLAELGLEHMVLRLSPTMRRWVVFPSREHTTPLRATKWPVFLNRREVFRYLEYLEYLKTCFPPASPARSAPDV